MKDTLVPERVTPLLPGRFGRPYVFAESCASTQLLLDETFPEGAVAVCDEQTAGRGRLGRRWLAPPGTAILCSLVLRPPAGRAVVELSLVAGIATAQTVESASRFTAQIKWPNDVLVEQRKVAGVLAEGKGSIVLLGVGINVNQEAADLPRQTRTPAASLRTLDGRHRDRAPILTELLARLEACYDRWLERGLDHLLPELRARDFLRGRRVTVDGVGGTALGITAGGRLEFDVDGQRRAVVSGDVRCEP